MRIRYKAGEDDFTTLVGVTKMTAEVGDGDFAMVFEVPQRSDFCEYGIGKVVFRREADSAETYEKAAQTFRSVQTSLALNGYANLVIGETTALIGDEWTVEEMKL